MAIQIEKHKTQIDPTFKTEGNELADQIIQERASLKNLRLLLNELDWDSKFLAIVVAISLRKKKQVAILTKFQPIEDARDTRFVKAAHLLAALKLETFFDGVIETASAEPSDNKLEIQQLIILLVRVSGWSILSHRTKKAAF